jgi:hypothetical protein
MHLMGQKQPPYWSEYISILLSSFSKFIWRLFLTCGFVMEGDGKIPIYDELILVKSKTAYFIPKQRLRIYLRDLENSRSNSTFFMNSSNTSHQQMH